jgi:hydroxymethylglutaryl-CoA lyase/(R)-citramalyl-CoA lyase
MTVTICDVAPRDGLQTEEPQSLEMRRELIARLRAAGLQRVEVGSFVSPSRVPQMAGTEELAEPGLAGLVLNERGYDRLAATSLTHVNFAFAVTDEYNQRNQGASTAQSLAVAEHIASRAHADGRRVSVILAVSFGCPFAGAVPTGHVLGLAERAVAAGADEIVLADTIGVGVPSQVRSLVGGALGLGVPVGVHLHNTRNTGYANALAAVIAGATLVDASVGGIGGCPFAPRATGNIATEDLAYLLRGEGIETGLDIDALIEVSGWLESKLGHALPGELYRAGDFAGTVAAL